MNNNPTNNSLPNKDIQEEDLSHLKNYDLYKRLLEVFPEETRLTLRQTRLVDKDRKKFDRMLPFLAELTTTNNQNQIVNAFIDILLTFPDSGEWNEELLTYFTGNQYHFDAFSKYYKFSRLISDILELLAGIQEDGWSSICFGIHFWRQIRKALILARKSWNPEANFLRLLENEAIDSKWKDIKFYRDYYKNTEEYLDT